MTDRDELIEVMVWATINKRRRGGPGCFREDEAMKCLIGESIAFKLNPEETAAAMIWRKRVASIINRAIRREKAKAWDEGKIQGVDLMAEDSDGISINPYRRAKR